MGVLTVGLTETGSQTLLSLDEAVRYLVNGYFSPDEIGGQLDFIFSIELAPEDISNLQGRYDVGELDNMLMKPVFLEEYVSGYLDNLEKSYFSQGAGWEIQDRRKELEQILFTVCLKRRLEGLSL